MRKKIWFNVARLSALCLCLCNPAYLHAKMIKEPASAVEGRSRCFMVSGGVALSGALAAYGAHQYYSVEETQKRDHPPMSDDLKTAIMLGDSEAVAALLDHDSVNSFDPIVGYPLNAALSAGKDEVVHLLMEHGANRAWADTFDFERFGHTRMYPDLKDAMLSGDWDKISPLLDEMSLHSTHSIHGNLMGMAIKSENLELVELLLDRNASRLINGYSDLSVCLAAKKECTDFDLDLMGLLIRRDPSIVHELFSYNTESFSSPDERLLTIACFDGSLAMVELLIQEGANVNGDASWRVLLTSLSEGFTTVLETPFNRAAASGNISAIELLLRNGADIEKRGLEGMNPLLTAVYHGQEAVVKMLLERGASSNVANDANESALVISVKRGFPAISRILVESGAGQLAGGLF